MSSSVPIISLPNEEFKNIYIIASDIDSTNGTFSFPKWENVKNFCSFHFGVSLLIFSKHDISCLFSSFLWTITPFSF